MNVPHNAFKAALGRGERQIGLWSSLCSNIAAEIVAGSGFDWILLDTEHAPNDVATLLSQLQAMSAGASASLATGTGAGIGTATATAIVRPAWNNAILIKRILDIGAPGLLVPYVQNAAEAEQAVAATRYPPHGIRGVAGGVRAARYGRDRDYLQTAHEGICVLVQVETRSALDRLEEIAAVDGVDGVFIGPSDLAASFGHIGNPNHQDVQNAIRDAAQRLAAAGTPAGILATVPDDARRYLDWGYRFVAVGSDLALLARGADALARSFADDRGIVNIQQPQPRELADETQTAASTPRSFISTDWSKDPSKRAVYVADLHQRRIGRQEPKPSDAQWNLDALLQLAHEIVKQGKGPVLVGIDVVLGVPECYWETLVGERQGRASEQTPPPKSFVDWLRRLDTNAPFFTETVVEPSEWAVDRPWFRVPSGQGGLNSFANIFTDRMLRRIDRATGGNQIFAVSGIPGVVGGATRELWRDLVPHLSSNGNIGIWPFTGDLKTLLAEHDVVLCETYPALAYAAAKAPRLPTPHQRNQPKTRQKWREDVCCQIEQAQWVLANEVELGDTGEPVANDDDFDAWITAAAVLRCVLEGIDIASPDWIDERAQGTMLLAGSATSIESP